MKPRIHVITLGVDDLERALGADVDVTMARATNAGATIVKPAGDTFWGGYAGYFQDPDGRVWEVAWNPQWVVD